MNIMYKIKQLPEDFIVKEIPTDEFSEKIRKNGTYFYFILKKTNYNTERAIQELSNYFRVQRKFFGYAGNKDKTAVTEQYCSAKGNIKDIKIKDIEVKLVGYGNEPISLGDLKGNYFDIVIRNIEKEEKPKKIDFVPNYFDEQRFGMNKNNHLIGKDIIKGNFKEAVEKLLSNNPELQDFSGKNPNNYIATLRKLPKKILLLYIHSYQSYIWNKTVEQYLHCKYRHDEKIPLIGFGTEIKNKVLKEIIEKILKEEGVTFRDFILKQLPELSQEGTERNLFVKVEDLKIGQFEKDELNPEKYKTKISFFLDKGAYATNVIKDMLS
jgi:tRNA pseudouridine13 synthase